MKKMIKISVCILLVVTTVLITDLWQDKKALRQNIIRLHVVANSDTPKDQDIKLKVRDAIVEYLQPIVKDFSNKEQAMAYINENLHSIQVVANETLIKYGENACAVVTLRKEAFDTREYETFSLPAGVYDSLRIRIGDAQGKNWWCVVFPSLCLPATTEAFQDTAVSSGFHEALTDTLTERCSFRFFFLDCIGKIEKLFY